MKIYLGHSTKFNYQQYLYQPIISSKIYSQHQVILPHTSSTLVNSKKIIKSCQLFIAEVSYPSTGLGIELGWADIFQVPIYCFHQQDKQPTNSIKVLTSQIIPYRSTKQLISKINQLIATKS